MKKLVVILSLCSVGMLLTACAQKSEPTKKVESSSQVKHSSSSKSSRSSASSTTLNKKASESQSSTPWNADKDAQLQSFISSWQGKMGQSYTKYDGQNSLKASTGTTYPDIFSGNGVYMNNSRLSIGYSPTGEGPYDYNVVAIYNHDGTQPPLPNHITYLFAFHNGQPVALVDQSREGEVRVTETKNADVREAFQRIAGEKSTATSKEDNKNENPTFYELAVMTYTEGYHYGDLPAVEDTAQRGFLYLGYSDDSQRYTIGQGKSINTILFKQDGENIIYWTKDTSDGRPTALAKLVEHTVSISDLKAKYFATPEQQELVKQAADKMSKPE
ncbi:DUF4767 domain-containing protein [Ligilactobacillus animalis]|nr:DUF4767 domain-containing protein [Ligilactobacillus animalis]